MIGKFYESFGKEAEETQQLPAEVVDVLNEKLPSNFVYISDESGHLRAVPKPEAISEGIKLTTQIAFDKEKDAVVLARLSRIPKDKWDENFYRTQMKVPIKSAKIGDTNKLVPIEILSADPLRSEEVQFLDGLIYPYPFPGPSKMTFESPEGELVEIGIQQKAHDSLVEIKYMNVDFPALKIELYQYCPLAEDIVENAHTNKENQLAMTYSVAPANASKVKDAVTALHLFRGLINGTTKVNGHVISSEGGKGDFNTKQLKETLTLWETILKLEDKLGIVFSPSAEFPNEDMIFLTELQTCLLDQKTIVWRHPFDHFHVSGFHPVKDALTFEDYIGKDSIQYEFLEGPIPATLLGSKFNLYSRTEMKDFIITNIEWDDTSKEGANVYISDVPEKQWTLTRLYMTEAEVQRLKADAAKGVS